MQLKHLTDKTLLYDTKNLVQKERDSTTTILHHLKEIERRKLFCDLGYSSMVDYAVKELGYSHAAAGRRIQGARMIKQLPEIEDKIKDGTLSLSNINQAAGLFRNQNINEADKKRKILKKLENKTTWEAEKVLMEFAPINPLPRESQRPITPEYSQLKINVSNETSELLERAKSLMNKFSINDEFLKKLTEHALESITYKKFKIRLREQNPNSRYITSQTKREVHEKSQGVCEKCGSLFMLQFDHIEAFALGGKTEARNLRLLCFHCNQRARIRTYNQDPA
jgi:5-methylcytosine-specific restriction endonuclease McrA